MSREKVYIVDENDEVLGEKWRDDLTDQDCWRIISVWIENSKGEVLIQQRSLQKDLNPGLWTAGVIGTVTTSETYEQAAYKELEEEVGVSGVVITFKKRAHYRASFGYRNIQTYSCTIDQNIDDFVIQSEEVEQVKWIKPEDLREDLKIHPERYTIPDLWEEVYGFK